MKRLLLSVSLILLIIFPASDNQQISLPQNELHIKSDLNCPDYLYGINKINETNRNGISGNNLSGSNSDWYKHAVANIESEEYNISYDASSDSYFSPNSANNLRFIYHDNGFTAKSKKQIKYPDDLDKHYLNKKEYTDNFSEDWNVKFELTENPLSRNNLPVQSYTFKGGMFNIGQNKASIEDEILKINYTNNPEGMRQDFILKRKPDGDGILKLLLHVTSELEMIVSTDKIDFISNGNSLKLQYSSLKAWDANNKPVHAYFEKINTDLFAIAVKDEGAEYPLTIDPLTMDPLSNTPYWTHSGYSFGDEYGYCVSSAGDVNLDGYDDIIIGSPGFSGGQVSEGKAYLHHGSPTGFTFDPDWSYESNEANSRFGFSVSSAGDVNGDNYPDVIIGAPFFSGGENKEGKVYVFYGSSSGLSNSPDWQFESNKEFAQTGYSVSGAGDINSDGFDDIIIGSPKYKNVELGEAQGRIFIFFGSASGLSVSPEVIYANYLDGFTGMGYSVSGAGDINADGYDDVIFGSPYWPPPPAVNDYPESCGRVNVVFGSSTPGSFTGWSTEGEDDFSLFGFSISGAGDVNNDGYDDILIGSPNYYDGLETTGKSYVFLGSSTGLNSIPDWTLSRQNDGSEIDGFGRSVSGAGDVNGDGFDDIIIGAHYTQWDNIADTTKSSAFLYLGSSTGLPGYRDWRYNMMTQRSIHIFVSGAGDVNGDGLDDVILGHVGYSDFFPVSGVYVFKGQGNPLPVNLVSFTSIVNNRDVTLNWSTNRELNNNGFYIERSLRENFWTSVGFVEGKGTISEPVNYTFTDKNLTSGIYNYRLKQTDYNGNFEYFELSESVNIGLPDKYNLSQNYPNPFNPVTTINYDIPVSAIVTIKIYDMLGREIKTLVNEQKDPGYYTIKFNAGNLSSGIYFYKLSAGNFNEVKKLTVIK